MRPRGDPAWCPPWIRPGFPAGAPRGRPSWLGVVSERAQHATVDPQRLHDGDRVVRGEDIGCCQRARSCRPWLTVQHKNAALTRKHPADKLVKRAALIAAAGQFHSGPMNG